MLFPGIPDEKLSYIRAWATNSLGISYGGTNAIRTYDGFTTDYEGHVYFSACPANEEWNYDLYFG